MIRFLEIKFLELFKAYIESSIVFSLPLILLFFWLLLEQFSQRLKKAHEKSHFKSFLRLIGLALIVSIEYNHFVRKDSFSSTIQSWIDLISSPTSPAGTFFQPLEFIFSIFVGSPDVRLVHQELLCVFTLAYFIMVSYVGIKEYRISGVIFGGFSLSDFSTGKIVDRPNRSTSNELGSGDLAKPEEVARWVRPSGKKNDTKLHVKDIRGSGGILYKNAQLYIPGEQRNRHILAIAKTGGGKTTKMMLPILYNDCMDPDRSTIVIDSKPEMWGKLANLVKKHCPHKKVMLFNPLDRERSLSWNILAKIENDTDAKLIANTIVMATDNPSSKSDSPFFRNNALQLLNAIMVGLLNDPNDTLSMPRIHELVQSGMKGLCDWLEARPTAYRTSRAFVELARAGSQNADTIMSELSMRIGAWDLEDIRATTAFNEIDLGTIIREPTLFIVEFRESELEMLRPMANVIVIEMLRFLTKQAESFPGSKLPRPVGFVIDEFASALGRLPDIHVKLNTLRSRNVSIVAAIQSISQVKSNYGDDGDSVLAGFSSKFCIPNLDFQDSEWASKESGQMTIRFETSSEGTNIKRMAELFSSSNVNTQEQVQQRAVLTPDEIGRPADGRNTFFLPDTPPFQGFLTPFYQIPEMLKSIEESEKAPQLKLRDKPIEYSEAPRGADGQPVAQAAVQSNGLPPGISDVRGWSEEDIGKKIEEIKTKLDWINTTGSAKKWWEAFETENQHRKALILRLAEELSTRNATITEFFLSYVYSNTDNIQANLHYLDYSRLKKEEEKRKKDAPA